MRMPTILSFLSGAALSGKGAGRPATGETPRPAMPALSDPSNVESEFQGGDLATKAPAPRPSDADTVALIEKRFTAATNARRYHDPRVFLSLAFYLGEQQMGWSTNTGKLVDSRNLEQSWRQYSVRNKIKPKCWKLQSKALETKPDPSFRPTLWESQTDRLAAAEARAVRAHMCRVHDEDQQISDEALWAIVTGMVFRKYYWDPTMEAEVPDYDDRYALVGTRTARVGDIARDTVPIVDLYPDPKARVSKGRITRCAWIIHSHVRDLEDVRDHYGAAAMHLDGEVAGGQDGHIETRMSSIVGDQQRQAQDAKTSVVVKECWERPSIKYPEGRLIVIAGGKVLRYEESWPCSKRDSYPFVPLCFSNGMGSFYGHGAVWDNIGAQRTYNRAVSLLDQTLENPWGKWMVARGAEIGSDSLNDPREVLYYNPGFRPEYQDPPDVRPVIEAAIAQSEADIDDGFGVHDVSDGENPTGITAASALEILRNQDTTQLKGFFTNLDTFVHQCAEWEMALASDYYDTPRLMAVQDVTGVTDVAQSGNPVAQAKDGGYAQVMAFRGLTGAGSCHVVMEAGTRAPLSPVARLQFIQDMYTKGFFGPVGDPRTSVVALELMDEVRSDALVERLLKLRREMQQEQKDAVAAQQALTQQQQDNQAQNDATLKLLQARLEQAQQQAAAQANALQNANDKAHAAELESVRLHGDLAKALVEHARDVEMQASQHLHEGAQAEAERARPSISLAGSLSPDETNEAAREAGLDVTEADAAPPEPTATDNGSPDANAQAQ